MDLPKESLTATFAALRADDTDDIDGILDSNIVPMESTAPLFQTDLASVSA